MLKRVMMFGFLESDLWFQDSLQAVTIQTLTEHHTNLHQAGTKERDPHEDTHKRTFPAHDTKRAAYLASCIGSEHARDKLSPADPPRQLHNQILPDAMVFAESRRRSSLRSSWREC